MGGIPPSFAHDICMGDSKKDLLWFPKSYGLYASQNNSVPPFKINTVQRYTPPSPVDFFLATGSELCFWIFFQNEEKR